MSERSGLRREQSAAAARSGEAEPASNPQPVGPWHTRRPSVYLDQWVWIRFAKVAAGRPAHPGDAVVLDAVRDAAARGVAFPLAATHYFETLGIADPRQRNDLAAVMAAISRFLNLPATSTLVRHQMLTAFHELYGRPAFRPAAPTVLDLGVGWSMTGVRVPLKIMTGSGGDAREVTEAEVPGIAVQLRSLGQLAEARLIAGPADDEIEHLRSLGYRPESAEASTQSRLAFEGLLADYLADPANGSVSRSELRAWVMGRELIHEYFDIFNGILTDYRIDPYRLFAKDAAKPGSMRADMMRLSDAVPTLRVAADMKLEVVRNAQRHWTVNMMHDIDALSLAVPYCHVVVPDRDAADLLTRSKAHIRYGTRVVPRLHDLPSVLADLRVPPDIVNLSGWDHVGPDAPYCVTEDDLPWRADLPLGDPS